MNRIQQALGNSLKKQNTKKKFMGENRGWFYWKKKLIMKICFCLIVMTGIMVIYSPYSLAQVDTPINLGI